MVSPHGQGGRGVETVRIFCEQVRRRSIFHDFVWTSFVDGSSLTPKTQKSFRNNVIFRASVHCPVTASLRILTALQTDHASRQLCVIQYVKKLFTQTGKNMRQVSISRGPNGGNFNCGRFSTYLQSCQPYLYIAIGVYVRCASQWIVLRKTFWQVHLST